MNRTELDKRLEAYYGGTSTLEDERWLQDYFIKSSVVPEQYKEDQALFVALSKMENEPSLPDSLNEKLESWMDSKLSEESSIQVKGRSVLFKYRSWVAVAASVLLLLGGAYLFRPAEPEIGPCLAVEGLTLEESVELTQKALLAVSTELNKSVSGLGLVQNKVKDVNRIMDKLKTK